MDDRFEEEFYKSPWHRVLPLGPHGIQPYVRAGRPGWGAELKYRLAAMLRALAQGLSEVREGLGAFGSFGRWGATGGARHATLARATRLGPLPSVCPSRAAPRTAAAAISPRPLRRAA